MKSIYTLLALLILPVTSFAQELFFVEFKDKPNATQYLANPLSMLTQDALDRRAKRSVSLDERDVPLSENYVSQIANYHEILGKSKWMNGVVISINNDNEKDQILSLPFVKTMESFVLNPEGGKSSKKIEKFNEESTDFFTKLNYGYSDSFIKQLNVNSLHDNGFTGKNIKVAVIDTGFPYVNTMPAFEYIRTNNRIKDTYSFVNDDFDVYETSLNNHGTKVLSNIAVHKDGTYVGTGFDADLYLYRTEDTRSETPIEMVNWVMAVERADSLGVEIINTSLGYYDFDDSRYSLSHAQMDGKTAFITKGANIATEKGIIVINSAGNERGNSWGMISSPADGFQVTTIGAVNQYGDISSFSSYGPTADNRIKPNIVAMGSFVPVYAYDGIEQSESIVYNSGTSFSSPIIAGAVASLIQGFDNFTVDDLNQILQNSADRSINPDNDFGYGIPDFEKARLALENLSIKDYSSTNVELFPNPTNDFVEIKSSKKVRLIEVFDLSGKKLLEQKNTKKISLKTIPMGVYFVNVHLENGSSLSKKVVKK